MSHFRINHRGTGSEQYPPAMMLALLIYCCATGRFGSRTIEAATYRDVAVRFIGANHHPDHASICSFRTANGPAFGAAFTQVLHLGHQLCLTRVGTVSVDGTKIAAHASKHAAVSYQRSEQAEVREAKESLDLPAELRRREHRLAALQRARQVIAERARELASAQQP